MKIEITKSDGLIFETNLNALAKTIFDHAIIDYSGKKRIDLYNDFINNVYDAVEDLILGEQEEESILEQRIKEIKHDTKNDTDWFICLAVVVVLNSALLC